MAIVAVITWVLVIGVKESAWVNNAMVVLKLAVLALFVGVGAFYIDPANWHPFAPNGWKGIHQGAAIVFFAYIGFDAVSTAAEETKDPQRMMPRGIMGSLMICTVIYVIVGAVATGLVPYQQLKGSDPLAKAFEVAGIGWGQAIISLGAIISMSAVLLVFQLGQPRIFFSMSRDGLLPPWFATVHPKYRTPHVTTILTGVVVALASTILDDDETYDLTNIGTLFAFLVVCVGVLALRVKDPDRPRPFRVPMVWVVAPAGALACLYVMTGLPRAAWIRFGIWMVVGAVFYFMYGYRHSRLAGRKT
jgi:APA family basic amino acid/polyamine antiporter